jgi:hypothetical protein
MNVFPLHRTAMLQRIILGAIGAAAAILLLQLKSPPLTEPARVAQPALPTDSPATSELLRMESVSPRSIIPAVSSQPLSFDQTMDLIHSKLRQWSERKTGDKDTDDRLMNELAALLTDENAEKIIKMLSPEELHGPFGTSALFRWMKTDPLTAANWVASRPDATDDQAWVIAHGLLADGIDLQKYAGQLPETKWKQTYLLDAGIDVLSSDPNEVIALAQQMDPGSTQTNLLQTAVTEWMGSDPGTTMNWITSVSDPTLRDKLISAGAKAYAATDPRQAATWAVSAMGPGETESDTILSIVNTWCSGNPTEAAAWIGQLPERGMRTSLVKAVLAQWLQSDPRAAASWAQSLPEGSQILTGLNSN